MRSMAFALAGTLLLGGTALGAAGDVLIVIGDRVNVRAGPGTEHVVTRQVARDQQMVEIERQGDWVHAEIVGTDGVAGWIHSSLVGPGREASAPEAGAADSAALGDETAPAPPVEDLTDAAAAREAGPLAPEVAVPGPADVDAVDLQRFRDSVAYLNSRSVLLGGSELFTEVEPLGGGAVQVGAGDAWASIPPAGQRSYAITLLDRWAAATGRSGDVSVRIVDQGGQVILEESRP